MYELVNIFEVQRLVLVDFSASAAHLPQSSFPVEPRSR